MSKKVVGQVLAPAGADPSRRPRSRGAWRRLQLEPLECRRLLATGITAIVDQPRDLGLMPNGDGDVVRIVAVPLATSTTRRFTCASWGRWWAERWGLR